MAARSKEYLYSETLERNVELHRVRVGDITVVTEVVSAVMQSMSVFISVGSTSKINIRPEDLPVLLTTLTNIADPVRSAVAHLTDMTEAEVLSLEFDEYVAICSRLLEINQNFFATKVKASLPASLTAALTEAKVGQGTPSGEGQN